MKCPSGGSTDPKSRERARLVAWVAARCEVSELQSMRSLLLYGDYCDWACERRLPTTSQAMFSRCLRAVGYALVKRGGQRMICGLALRDRSAEI